MEFPDERPPPRMGARRVVYRPNFKSFGAFMRSEQMRDVTADVANHVAHLAGQFAPRRKDRGTVPDGAAMADQFQVKREAGIVKVSGYMRVRVTVFNPARSAAPNEFGTNRNPRHRMLGRAGAVYGDFHTGDLHSDGGLG